MCAEASPGADAATGDDVTPLWHWFSALAESARAEAQRRATIVARVDLFKSSGMNPTAAVAAAAQSEGISSPTLWNWLRLVDGVPVKDRLPRLDPRRQDIGRGACRGKVFQSV